MNRIFRNAGAIACVLMLVFHAGRFSTAAMIPIANAGFENPFTAGFGGQPDSWVAISGGGSLWNINDDPQGWWAAPAPEGKQVLAVITNPSGASAIFSQVLSSTVQPDTVYTLTGYVGSIALGPPDYTVTVLAGGQLLTSGTGQAPYGSFTPFSLTFDSRVGNALAQIGQPFEIQLRSLFRYAAFDDLRLEAEFIPEPSALLLTAMGVLAAALRRPTLAAPWRRRRFRSHHAPRDGSLSREREHYIQSALIHPCHAWYALAFSLVRP